MLALAGTLAVNFVFSTRRLVVRGLLGEHPDADYGDQEHCGNRPTRSTW